MGGRAAIAALFIGGVKMGRHRQKPQAQQGTQQQRPAALRPGRSRGADEWHGAHAKSLAPPEFFVKRRGAFALTTSTDFNHAEIPARSAEHSSRGVARGADGRGARPDATRISVVLVIWPARPRLGCRGSGSPAAAPPGGEVAHARLLPPGRVDSRV